MFTASFWNQSCTGNWLSTHNKTQADFNYKFMEYNLVKNAKLFLLKLFGCAEYLLLYNTIYLLLISVDGNYFPHSANPKEKGKLQQKQTSDGSETLSER